MSRIQLGVLSLITIALVAFATPAPAGPEEGTVAAATAQNAAAASSAEPAEPLAVDETPAIGSGEEPSAGSCVCRCTCPSSGFFVYQCHELPLFASGCGDLNGDTCSPPFSTCNVPDVLQGCVPEAVAPVSCP